MPIKRLVVLGDPHGCLTEVRKVLDVIRFDPAADEFWSIGDNIDRGPNPLGVCRFLMGIGVHTLLGNHEVKVLRRLEWEGREPRPGESLPKLDAEAQRSFEAIREDAEVVRWLREAPLGHYEPESNVVLVHAGIKPGRPAQHVLNFTPPWGGAETTRESKDLLREVPFIRFVRPRQDGSCFQVEHGKEGPDDEFWAQRWSPRAPHIVFGHQSFREVRRYPNATGIDQGCCFGGALTVAVIPLGERDPRGWTFHSIPASCAHSAPPAGIAPFLD